MSTPLIQLDSPIVQIDTYSKFLLVSSNTRSVLCDTERECYRQIGKKLRDGPFGSCFFNITTANQAEENLVPKTHSFFKNLTDGEELSPISDAGVKIYCARPGVRLWQANFQAEVILTHQFRQSLDQKQSEIIYLEENNTDSDLKIIEKDPDKRMRENFNFSTIFRCLDEFILTFNKEGIFIFEPSLSRLYCWIGNFSDIRDLKILNSTLYIWYNNLNISVISLIKVEDLILKTLFKKQFNLCAQITIHFLDIVENLLDKSRKIHLISILQQKIDDPIILSKLNHIFTSLNDSSKKPTLENLKTNGIVTISNIFSEAVNLLPESVASISNIEEKSSKIINKHINLLLEQYKVNKTHRNIEIGDLNKIFQIYASNPTEFYKILTETSLENLNSVEETPNFIKWSKEIYLKYLKHTDCNLLESHILEFSTDAFIELNQCNFKCICNFPIPKNCNNKPKYYEIGCKLMEVTGNDAHFLTHVPFLNKFVLEKISDCGEIKLKLPLLVQFSDLEIIRKLINIFTYDIWDESIKLLIKLKTNRVCLNCGREISTEGSLDWNYFAISMVQSINAQNTINLLKHYHNFIPKSTLNGLFYQLCIFSSVSDNSKITKLCEGLQGRPAAQREVCCLLFNY